MILGLKVINNNDNNSNCFGWIVIIKDQFLYCI